MMVDPDTRAQVRAVLHAVRFRPTELPLAEVLDLANGTMGVSIDRTGEEPVVYVSPRRDSRFESLTEREYEVARLMAAGFANAQIAETLFISLPTVKDHVHSILGKTNLSRRSEVAACWYGLL